MNNEDEFLCLMMNFDAHEIDEYDIIDAVECGKITIAQYEEIVGKEYPC